MASSPIKNVALLGASGIPGPFILKELLASPLNVTVISRVDSKATFPPGTTVIRADYTSPASLRAALANQDAVVSLLGHTAYTTTQKLAIDAAAAAGVRRFIPSEFGVDTSSDEVVARVPFVRAKREVVEYLRGKEGEGLEWTAVITGTFFDWGLWQGWFGFDLERREVMLWDGGEAVWAATELDVVGKALVGLLGRREAYARARNGYVYVAGQVTSQREVWGVLERVTGERFVVATQVDAEEHAERVRREMAEGKMANALDLLKAVTFDKRRKLGVWEQDWSKVLRLPKLDLEQTVREVVEGKRNFVVSNAYDDLK
ncbi:hypothetical protein B0J12DRAFT_733140 [Macrophomina phaseolina]|uniref:NAD(P)-binding domain-containing protein n=1 Tax=Macrophomina phaseolina TaxID=35725 RepID=A0ABQ8FT19_9PEZI|nr:hypothetical protein B0J12DRAFT_733140 [Macrophomina phaseolina]